MDQTQSGNKKKFYKRTWFWILAGVVVVVVIGSSGKKDQIPQTSSTTPSSSYVMNSGEQGYLRNGQNEVVVSKSEAAENSIVKAAIANDTTGMTEVVTSGQAYFVKDGTKVLVIVRISGGITKVRILE